MKVEIRKIQQQAAHHSPFAVYVDGAYHCAADSREHAMSLIAERFPKAEKERDRYARCPGN